MWPSYFNILGCTQGVMQNRTSIVVEASVRDRLADLKPYGSMSFNDLLQDMADEYESAGDAGD